MKTRLLTLVLLWPLAGCPRPAPEGSTGGAGGTAGDGGTTTCGATACGAECVDTNSNPKHCGSCGHDCLGGGCDAGLCQRFTLTPQDYVHGLALSQTHVYYSNLAGDLVRIPIDGGEPEVLASSLFGEFLAVTDTTVYAAGGKYVYAVPLDGTDYVQLNQEDVFLEGLAVSPTHFYWVVSGSSSGPNTGYLQWGPLGGTNHSSFAAMQNDPRQLVVDATHVYWISSGDSTLLRSPLDGGTPETIASVPSASPWILAVDQTHVYWTNLGAGIARVAKNGGKVEPIATANSIVDGLAVDGTDVYFTSSAQGLVAKTSLATGKVTKIDTKSPDCGDIAVDSKAIYWEMSGTLVKLAK